MLRQQLLAVASSPALEAVVRGSRAGSAVAHRFVAGDHLGDAVGVAAALTSAGAGAVLDHLGESTTSIAGARSATGASVAALERAREAGVDATVAVKLTALGLAVDPALAEANVERVAREAQRFGTQLEIDMESYQWVDQTLALAEHARAFHDRAAVCLQASLRRTPADLERMLAADVAVRLVKGAYRETAQRAYPARQEVNAAYAALLIRLVESGVGAKVATHDPKMIALAKRVAAATGRGRDIEFQMLYGVRRDLQAQLIAEGYRMRVYVPYGRRWYPYLTRRMGERPANLWFFLSHAVRR